tara:strand:+ start:65 stop:268 length:204 start_codon:yes stop_codon:yes gene_type:complete
MNLKKKRIRVPKGGLASMINEEKFQKMFGEVVSDIMEEKGCTWTEAKKIYKFRRAEKNIKREFNLIK